MQHNSTEIYDTIANEYAASFKEKEEEVKFIKAFLNLIPKHGSVIDLGCGNCDYYYIFEKYPIVYEGIDISKGMLEIAQKQWPKGNFSHGDILEFELEESAHSGVFAFYSLIHFNDIEFRDVIVKIKNCLSSGGLFLLALQEGEGELFKESPFLKNRELYINLYKESELCSLLEKNGFEVLQKEIKHTISSEELSYSKILLLLRKNT